MRVIRACRELGIRTVAIHSEVDAQRAARALRRRGGVRRARAAPRKSYLNIPAIISAAEITGADAIHPGYGFLSENAAVRRALREVRPHLHRSHARGDAHLGRQGQRARRREAATACRSCRAPACSATREHALEEAERIGFPVIIKASGGGGGRGMRIVRERGRGRRARSRARRAEAMAGFKNPDVYLERFVEEPRHIEFQVLADQHGGVWTLGERECSLQRRHQKVMEEAPSPAMTAETARRRWARSSARPSSRPATPRSARSSSSWTSAASSTSWR